MCCCHNFILEGRYSLWGEWWLSNQMMFHVVTQRLRCCSYFLYLLLCVAVTELLKFADQVLCSGVLC